MNSTQLIYLSAAGLVLALAAAQAAWVRDAKREAARTLSIAEACAESWERQIDATDQCLSVLDVVRASDLACACWEVPR